MLKIILTQLAVFIAFSLSAQSFEGKITYANTYKSKMPNVSDQQFAVMMGTTQEYYIKDGNYKSVLNGTVVQWQLYINKDNKLYSKMGNSVAVLWNDGAENKDEVLKAEVHKNVATVLGYSCDELVLTCKNGVQKYYYNTAFAVDAKLFVNHKFGNWYELVSRSSALPLKYSIESEMFTMESTATNVAPLQLEKSFFELPANVTTTKSPY